MKYPGFKIEYRQFYADFIFWYILLGNVVVIKEKKNEWKEKWKNETTSKELVMGVV